MAVLERQTGGEEGEGVQNVEHYADIIYGWSLIEPQREQLPGDRPRLDAPLGPGERLPALHAAVLRRQAAAAPEERARNQARDDLKYSRIR